MFIDGTTPVYWLGIKYTVEVSFRGNVIAVFDCNDENIIDDREGFILTKWQLIN